MRKERQGSAQDAEKKLHERFVRALAGDEATYREFLADLGVLLRGFLRRRLERLPDDVEDLVQETLLAVHNQRHTYDPSQPLTAWVYAIARYKLVDFLRRRAMREALDAPLDDEQEWLRAPEAEAASTKRDLAVLLAGLPDRQRLPILHMKLEGLSAAETAIRTGMSESAVKVGVHRGLKALAALIREKP